LKLSFLQRQQAKKTKFAGFFAIAPHIVIAGRFWPLSGAIFWVIWKKKSMLKRFKKGEIQAFNRLSLCRSKQGDGQVQKECQKRVFLVGMC